MKYFNRLGGQTMKIKFLSLVIFSLFSNFAYADNPLRLGMTPEPYLPFTAVRSNGEWIGLEADLSRALCERIEVKCQFKSMAWDGLLPSLNEKKIDFAIGAFSVTEERAQTIDFSTPYFVEGTAVVGAKKDQTVIATIKAKDGKGDILDQNSLQGKIIGVQVASVQSKYMKKYLPNVHLKSYDTADNNAADLVAGRTDYMLAPLPFSQDFLKTPFAQNYEIKLIIPDNVMLGQGVAYAIKKGDKKTLDIVNKALQELADDGTLKKIQDKWVDSATVE